MPVLSQGDIFKQLRENECVAIIFGHIGINLMGETYKAFRKEETTLSQIHDPFASIPNTPHCISSGQWLWFVPEQENHGMREEELETVLDSVFSWAKDNGHKSVITNGIRDIDHDTNTDANRKSDAQRTEFLIRYSERQEKMNSLGISLISLNDAFIRNAP